MKDGSNKSTPEKKPELPPGIAPERTGNGTFDDWKPGDKDPNITVVHESSDDGNGLVLPDAETIG